jgi:nucleotide-binding universal stress UspA family protein
MTFTVLLCADGSERAEQALAEGLAVCRPADRVVVATVVESADPMLTVGTGLAGGVMSPVDVEQMQEFRVASANELLGATCERLGLSGAETVILEGEPGRALCELAASLPASVIVLGTRGRGGFRRAVLGSVSDHVVRHAPCPVVTRSAS